MIIIIPDLGSINKKEGTCHQADFAFQAKHRVIMKENEKTDKYLDLAKELKKAMEREYDGDTKCSWFAWKGLERRREELEIRGRIDTIQSTALLRSAKILGRVLDSWSPEETCCLSVSSERPPIKTGVKNSQVVK